jgi:hypothetical protein
MVSRNTHLSHSGLSGIIFPYAKRDSRQAGMTGNRASSKANALNRVLIFGYKIKLIALGPVNYHSNCYKDDAK